DNTSNNNYVGGITGYYVLNNTSRTKVINCSNHGAVTLSNSSTDETNNYLGGIVGGTNMSDCAILGCFNDGDITGITQVGGIIGHLSSPSPIENNGNAGTVKGRKYVGGIVGDASQYYSDVIIKGCYNTGNIVDTDSETIGEKYIAGVVGNMKYDATVENCYNTGTVTAYGKYSGGIVGHGGYAKNCYNTGAVNGEENVGGIMGYSGATIEDSYNTGAITGKTNVGGISGGYDMVKRCFNTGDITGEQYVGGIKGNSWAKTENCYNTGAIIDANPGSNGEKYFGGIAGYVSGDVEKCYNIGAVASGSKTGEIAGDVYYSNTVQKCYYLADSTNTETGALSQEDFADESKFVDWSFGEVWAMYKETGGFKRPYLAKVHVRYYDKTGELTPYVQALTLLGIDGGTLEVRLYSDSAINSIDGGYYTYYQVDIGAHHAGWATEFGGEKAYDFNEVYTGTEELSIYPAYDDFGSVTVEVSGYTGTHAYDNDTHELTVTATHDLGAEATYTYQWYKLNGEVYEEIDGATNATFDVMNVTDSGTYKVIATMHFAGYAVDGAQAGIVVTITKIDPEYTLPTGLVATYGQTLADVALSDGWSWPDSTRNVGNVGEQEFTAIFTPEDANNYNVLEKTVTVMVGKANPVYGAPADLTATIGDTLADVSLLAWSGWTWNNPETVLNKAGSFTFGATYTPEDTDNYNVVENEFEVSVYHGAWSGSGTGTSTDPYVIATKEQLEHFRDIVNGYYLMQGQSQKSDAYGVLAASIVLGGESEPWTPIGAMNFSGSYYRGTFDGAGFTVSGLYVYSDDEEDYAGFFGRVNGTVKNLTVSGTIICKTGGGITGRLESGKVIGCTNNASVTGAFSSFLYVGGMTGYCTNGTITDCVNHGNLIGYEAGGMVGHMIGGKIENCVNDTDASIVAANVGGGMVGEIEHNDYGYPFYGVLYCINSGEVGNSAGRNAYLGGIVGYSDCGPIEHCFNEGTITNGGSGFWAGVGGIVGRFCGRQCCVLENCYNTAAVTCGNNVGGIVGIKTGGSDTIVRNCYNFGAITASNDQNTKGEILGQSYNDSGITIENCYYLDGENKKGCGNIADAEGVMAPLTAAEFADASNFDNWFFGDVWAMYTDNNVTRPYLVVTCIKYYDKAGEETTYAQAKTLLGVNGALNTCLRDEYDFDDEYADLYGRNGYAHNGWATAAGGEVVYDFGDMYNASESIGLYPHYTIVTYTITYVNALNGTNGITNVNPTSYTVEDEDVVLIAPTRIGYDLTAWTGEGVTIETGSFGNKIFEATWTVHAYTITYVDAVNGENGVTNANPTTYTINDDTIEIGNPSRNHYDFVRWTGDGMTIYAGSTGDRTYVAHWTVHEYTITYSNAIDGVDGVTNANPKTYTVEDDNIELIAPTRIGYELASWTGEGVTIETGSFGDKIFEATWTLETYTITYEGEEGVENANPVSYSVEDLPIALADLTREHYDFIGWANGDADPATGYVIAAGTSGNIALTAVWAPHAYTITYVNAENGVGGVVNTNPTSYTVEDGDVVLIAPTRVGYELTSWTGEGVTIAAGSYGDKTYEATWEAIVYTISYVNDLDEMESVSNPNPVSYTIEDLPLVLVAPTSTYYDFIGWIADDELTEEYTIDIERLGDVTLTTSWYIKGDIGNAGSELGAPTIRELNGYVATYDGKAHEISVVFAHDLDVTYSYRWKKNGVLIQGATGATLSVKDVADSGTYTLLYTVSYEGESREEAETPAIVVSIGKKNVMLNLPAVTTVEGKVADATATIFGKLEGDRIGVIITYRKGDTELSEKPTRAGAYTVVASIADNNYEADPVEAAFVINVAEIAPENIVKPEGSEITVSCDDGFGEDTKLIITNPDPDNSEVKAKIGDDKEIVEIHHFELKEGNEAAELEEPVTIRIPIPEELKDEKFALINVDGDDSSSVKYKIDGDFVEFETLTMGDFVFVKDEEKTPASTQEISGGLIGPNGKISTEMLIYLMLGVMALNLIMSIVSVIKMSRKM
ncbi:MAG: InlB B-repeat-containing protein, partial [Clostridia bacterium]|nr:InlB B-repeat-containing protein [Clostridia bacterium]